MTAPHLRRPLPVDVCIVGTGATGGTVAKVLTEAGLRVVGLERGPWIRPEAFSGDELKYISRGYLEPDLRLKPRTRRHDEHSRAEINAFSPLPQLVGGGSVHWNTWVPRPRPSDFRMRSLHGEIPGASLADWPITYDELEPYLTKLEWEFGVSGISVGPHEPPRSADYPCPPVPVTRYGMKFYEACAKLGIDAGPVPQGLVTREHNGRPAARCTGFWNLYGDPTLGKSTTLTSFIPAALATGRYEVRPDSYATRVLSGRDGRATGVAYLDAEGREVEQEASIVILCASAIESARLLLLSASNRSPDGLSNSSGLVGRNATFHEYLYAVGLFDKELHDPLYGWTGYYLNGGSFEFYETDASRGHLGGSYVTASGIQHPVNWAMPDRPMWGQAMKDADRDYFNHAMKVGMILHDLPRESNRVDLDPVVKDAWGLPVARITHRSHANDLALATWQIAKNAEILQAAGASKIFTCGLDGPDQIAGNSTHQHGTARMGDDPARSVLDRWCRSHDVDNLYVMDGSCFPTATGVNPTLTMMANAWRCAERIAQIDAKGRGERGGSRAFIAAGGAAPPEPAASPTSKSEWVGAGAPVDPDSDERLFFHAHEWDTIEAAVARIMPADEDPGAREARVIVFIDRYLSGLDYVYAAADGSGFLRLAGKEADAWRGRIRDFQDIYRGGIRELDERARAHHGKAFKDLTADGQDDVLAALSGLPKPERVLLGEVCEIRKANPPEDWDPQRVHDDGLRFFPLLALHTRQGYYGDPVYGGNREHIGWRVIGYPGPQSLADTNAGRYDVEAYMLQDLAWPYVEADEPQGGGDQALVSG
jgi:choline dehydrogenase-like flavoprotein